MINDSKLLSRLYDIITIAKSEINSVDTLFLTNTSQQSLNPKNIHGIGQLLQFGWGRKLYSTGISLLKVPSSLYPNVCVQSKDKGQY
jgi:hypothetical protein